MNVRVIGLTVCAFFVMPLVMIGVICYDRISKATQPLAVAEDSLVARVAKLERMLADDVPSEKPVTPAQVETIVTRREEDKEARRRASLVRQINQSIVFNWKDGVGTVIEFTVRDKLTPVKEDKILQAVLDDYRAEGWDVQYVEGPFPTSPNNSGVYKFKKK